MEIKEQDILKKRSEESLKDIQDLAHLSFEMDNASYLIYSDIIADSDYADDEIIEQGIKSFRKAQAFVDYLISCSAKDYVSVINMKEH